MKAGLGWQDSGEQDEIGQPAAEGHLGFEFAFGPVRELQPEAIRIESIDKRITVFFNIYLSP